MKHTDHAAARIEIETETRTVQANGWVEAGEYHTAAFRGMQPENVRGCPLGRSQHSAAAAVADLIRRTNDESGTNYTAENVTVTRHNGEEVPAPAAEPEEAAGPAPRVLHLRQDTAGQWQYQTREAGSALIPWQYGGFDKAATIAQARDRFSFDEVDGETPAARTWNESPAFSSLDDSEPYPEPEEAAAQSAAELAAIAGRKAGEALEAYAAALDRAADAANAGPITNPADARPTNGNTRKASELRTTATIIRDDAKALRTEAARLI